MKSFRDEYPEVFGEFLDADSSSFNGYDSAEINSVPFWHAILDDFVERQRGRHRDANPDQREHPKLKLLGPDDPSSAIQPQTSTFGCDGSSISETTMQYSETPSSPQTEYGLFYTRRYCDSFTTF